MSASARRQTTGDEISYFAWQQHLCFGHSLRTRRAFPASHQERLFHPLRNNLATGDSIQLLARRTDDKRNLEFLDAVTNRNQFAGTPKKTILLDRSYRLLQSFHVSLIIPRLHVESDDRLRKKKMSIKMWNDATLIATFAAGLAFPAFFALYSATRSALIRSASASSSSSDPKRSTSSSSSAAAAAGAAPETKASPAVLVPDRDACSAAYDLM